MITAAQLRAARGLLDWTRADLAKAANISPETVKNIEHGTFRPQENTADAIIRAFAAYDVKFTENGVQIHKDLVRTFIGKEGLLERLEHAYETISHSEDRVTRHLALADNYVSNFAPEYLNEYARKMEAIPNIDARCLIWEGNVDFPFDGYCKYRWIKKSATALVPYYVYDNYVSFMMHSTPEFFMSVSIYSEFLADSLKKQFDLLWAELTTPVKK